MDPLTIGLLGVGAYMLLKGPAAPAPAPAAQPVAPVMTSPTSSIIQYSANVPPPRAVEDTGASPIEQSGYIPPYQATAGSSAVALGGMGTCGCASCSDGLGDARTDRSAVQTQLRALRATYRPQIAAAINARNSELVKSLTQALHARLKAILAAYHQAHPNERPEVSRVAKTVAPVFMGPRGSRRSGGVTTNV